jgi:uncharacterized protein (TIGR00106 family)
MIVADVTFYPIGSGVSAGKTIKGAIEKLKEGKVECYPNSMATVIEANTLDDLFASIKKAEKFIISEGFQRVETILKIDHRIDVENTVERKINAIK